MDFYNKLFFVVSTLDITSNCLLVLRGLILTKYGNVYYIHFSTILKIFFSILGV